MGGVITDIGSQVIAEHKHIETIARFTNDPDAAHDRWLENPSSPW